jgi:hypothetical protein
MYIVNSDGPWKLKLEKLIYVQFDGEKVCDADMSRLTRKKLKLAKPVYGE